MSVLKLIDQGFFFIMRSTIELAEFVKSLYADEAVMVANLLPSIIGSKQSNGQIIKRERSSLRCPHCSGLNVVRNGTKAGRQRYQCHDCRRTFSDTSASIVFKTKYTYEEWLKFIHCELNNYSLKHSATYSNISQTTAFSWRHKIYEAISIVKKRIILSGEIEIDATFMPINLKGTKKTKMPRLSKKRTSSAYRGISHHKVCILSAVDDRDRMFFEIVGLGPETNEMANKIKPKIKECRTLVSDGSWTFQTLAKELNSKNEMIKAGTYKNENGYTLSTINGLHSELKTDLKKRRGVSIRHLQGYLDMFLFKKMLNYQIESRDKDNVGYRNTIPNEITLYIKEIFEKAIPIDLYEAYREYNFLPPKI